MKILLTRICQLTRPPSVLVDLKYLSSGMLAEVLWRLPKSHISIMLNLQIYFQSQETQKIAMNGVGP